MALPRMDVPVGVVSWEVFAPSDYSMRVVDGNVIDQRTVARALEHQLLVATVSTPGMVSTESRPVEVSMATVNVAESVTVTGATPTTDTAQRPIAPSQNVINLQRRIAGVLPVRVDVPRAGSSHQFVKPLVVDQETQVTFRYKRR